MLGDWESYPIPPGMLTDLSPRHAPEIRFRPHTVNVRREEGGHVVVISISGNRLINGQPNAGTRDHWEWDRDRDPGIEWVAELIVTVIDR